MCALLVSLAALAVGAGAARAQSTGYDYALQCIDAGGDGDSCRIAATTAEVVNAQVALAAGAGTEIPGTSTTLGTRVGGGPRLAFSVQAGMVDMTWPDLTAAPGSGAVRSGWATALHARAASGIFEGFQIMPTVGGFLSVDVFGQASFLFLPSDEGLEGGGRAWTLGGRVGLIREGFTLPGVSVSVARRFIDDVETAGLATDVLVSPGVTSLRATVGKDLFAVEWMAGFGIERLGGDATVVVPVSAGSVIPGPITVSGEQGGDRTLWFGGASTTIGIVFTISLEAGWSEGSPGSGASFGGWDSSDGVFFGGLAARLTL